MVFILRFASGLIFLVAALVSSVSAVGRLMPVRAEPWFTYRDGTACILPCLFGIRPGETPYENAIYILGMHPFTQGFNFYLSPGPAIFHGSQISVNVVSGSNGGVVRVSLLRNGEAAFPSELSSLGDVILRMGGPFSSA